MTSDAKLGLLVGLILIIAIVFALNGLPGVIEASQNEDSKEVIKVATEDIMSTARETVRTLVKLEPADVEAEQPLLKDTEIAQSYNFPIPTVGKERFQELNSGAVEYTVESNDNLATIAKKFYGPEEGNRIANIKKIAQFNNLKSRDFIYQGQKLKIPPLNPDRQKQFVKVKTFSDSVKEGIRNIIPLPAVSVTNRASSNHYIVQENDTLWSIAQQQLGDGNRYHEILKANPEISDADMLETGMQLKLPDK